MKFLILTLSSCVFVFGDEIHKAYVNSNNDFAINLVNELCKGHNNNVVFSSFSLETVLGLTALGAKGDTADEIKSVIQTPKTDEQLKEDFKHVQTELRNVQDVVIASANRIYIAEGLQVLPEFNKTANEIFNSDVQNLNFGESEKSANEINNWVRGKTEHKIRDLLKPDQLSNLTRMVLVNAVYFKGKWQHPFDIEKTEQKNFHISRNATIQVDTMEITADLYIHRMKHHDVTFYRLPYGTDDRAVLTFAVPDDPEGIDVMRTRLKKAVPAQKYEKQLMKLFVPKFRMEANNDMKKILERIGLKKIFEAPDFSGISDEKLKVDHLNQKVFFDVNEEGTEAAAATAETAVNRIMLVPKLNPPEYHIDRPFFFCLQYDNIALITGRVMNPLDGNMNKENSSAQV